MRTLRNSILVLLLFAGSALRAQNPETITRYINEYKDLAIEEMKRTGVPAAIKLAQGIHETSAGTSVLVVKSNNHFGIKCKANWTGASVSHTDDAPNECFRKYEKPDQSYRDHSDFLKNSSRYAALFKLDPLDYEGWAYGLKKAGYATNPKYPQVIIKLIREYQLQEYTLIALGKSAIQSEVLVKNDDMRQEPLVVPAINKTEIIQAPVETVSKIVTEPVYPEGEFRINDTRVIYARKGIPFLSIAEQYNIPLARLFEFNDLSQKEIVEKDQLIFLQRKRKTGNAEYHIVKANETLYDIAQAEAIRLEALLDYNMLKQGMKPAIGEKLYLKTRATAAPQLALKENYGLTKTGSVSLGNSSTNAAKQEIISATRNLSYYVVQPKETVYSIAKRFNVSVDDIIKWNLLSSYDLKTGQQLKIYK
jgi:LysM repeat protein